MHSDAPGLSDHVETPNRLHQRDTLVEEVEEPLDDLDDSGLLVEKQLRQYMPDEQDPRR